MKALTTTHWGKSKETLNITYNAISTRNKQNRTSTPTLHKKTPSTTPHKQIANPTRRPTQNHSRKLKHTQHRTVPSATHNHATPNTYLTAQGCRPTWAPRRCGMILGGGGGLSTGPLVGPAGVGYGAAIAGGGTTVGAPRGRQQQHASLASSFFYFFYY